MSPDRQYQIFVVDPDDAVRDGINILLDSFGIRVHSYVDGRSFLDEAADSTTGCVLIEANLPDYSGVELVKSLRRAGNVMPVLLMTSSPDIGLTRQAVSCGAATVLRKPLVSEHLLAWLEALLRLTDDNRTSRDSLSVKLQSDRLPKIN